MRRPFRIRGRGGRRALIAGVLFLVLATGSAGWVAVRSAAVRENLLSARAAVTSLRARLVAGERSGAEDALRLAQARADAAVNATANPVWSLVAAVPFAGRPARAVRALAQSADDLARYVLPDLIAAAPGRAGRGAAPAAGQEAADLAAIVRAQAPLADADRRLAAAIARLDGAPADSGLGEVDAARADLGRELTRLHATVATASTATRLLPSLLGTSGARRYFLAFQTGAEARGTGGLVGAYGLVLADHGHVSFPQLAADDAIEPAADPVADFGPQFTALYGADEAAQLLANSNLSPHFPYAAQIWTGLWRRQTGQRLDGAIATDPEGLANLLSAIGTVTLPGGEQITAGNVVPLTEQTAYARYSDPVERKRYLIRIATAVVGALSTRPHDLTAIVRALSSAVSGGHLMMWSSHPEEESALAATPAGGVLPGSPGPFAELVVNNASGTKLDYYLSRSLTYSLGACKQGVRTSTVRVQLTNGAPAKGLPDYAVYRMDDPQHVHVRGSNKLWVSIFAADGAQLIGATLDGAPQPMSVNTELGHSVFGTGVDLDPGQTRTLRLQLTEPASAAPPVVPRQPLPRAQLTRVDTTPC